VREEPGRVCKRRSYLLSSFIDHIILLYGIVPLTFPVQGFYLLPLTFSYQEFNVFKCILTLFVWYHGLLVEGLAVEIDKYGWR
jgi:hypothetical protein